MILRRRSDFSINSTDRAVFLTEVQLFTRTIPFRSLKTTGNVCINIRVSAFS